MSQVIHILGGGLAGLSAAIRLRKYGFHPVIIEKNHYLGGRVRSFVDKETGDEIDNGQHLLMANNPNLLEYLKLINASGNIDFQKEFYIPFFIKNNHTLQKRKLVFPALPYPFHLILGGLKTDLFTWAEKKQLMRLISLKRKSPAEFNGKNAYSVLKEFSQSDQLIKLFWEPFLVSVFNSPIHKINGPAFVELIQQTIVFSGKMIRLGFPRQGLSHALIRPAENWLRSQNIKIFHKTLIKSIEFNKEKMMATALVDGNGNKIPVERLIVALPQRNLLQLLPVWCRNLLWNDNPEPMEYAPIISVYLWTKQAITHESHIAFIGSPFHWMFNKRVYGGPLYSDYFVYQFTTSAGYDLAERVPAYIESLLKKELETFFPDFDSNQVVKVKVIKEKLATPLASSANERLRKGSVTPFKNVYLAGDWTDTKLPFTMESAVKSGFDAAEKIISSDYFES